MSLRFLTPSATPGPQGAALLARSPMERLALAAGARLQERRGWSIVADYGSSEHELEVCGASVGWSDVSHLGTLEVHAPEHVLQLVLADASGGIAPERGVAKRAGGTWWCPITPRRALVLCDPTDLTAARERLQATAAGSADATPSVVDVTTAHAALTVIGPRARDVLARFCALDLRSQRTPIGGFLPGSIARTPGYVLREDEDRFMMLFGWALGEYMWTVVSDAARHLGGAPVGADALSVLPTGLREAAQHA